MSKHLITGYSRASVTTRNGEVLDGYNIFFMEELKKGTGAYGTTKFITDDRLSDIGGLPTVGVEYEVTWDRFGNFFKLEKI